MAELWSAALAHGFLRADPSVGYHLDLNHPVHRLLHEDVAELDYIIQALFPLKRMDSITSREVGVVNAAIARWGFDARLRKSNSFDARYVAAMITLDELWKHMGTKGYVLNNGNTGAFRLSKVWHFDSCGRHIVAVETNKIPGLLFWAAQAESLSPSEFGYLDRWLTWKRRLADLNYIESRGGGVLPVVDLPEGKITFNPNAFYGLQATDGSRFEQLIAAAIYRQDHRGVLVKAMMGGSRAMAVPKMPEPEPDDFVLEGDMETAMSLWCPPDRSGVGGANGRHLLLSSAYIPVADMKPSWECE